MCGFGGVISHSSSLTSSEVGSIANAVKFRGPDSCGIRVLDENFNDTEQGNTALFFNRLAIIDLDKRSDQPFDDSDHLLIFNGEIYNYKELKNSLENLGVRFKTSSDTEVLFEALKHWGIDAINRLNGMFAFFWLDKRRKKFIVCRDRLGIKPLYYHIRHNSFYFSSELYSILRLSGEKFDISSDSVGMYLWLQFIPTPNTIFKNIFKLPPGSLIEGNTGDINTTMSPRIYWDAYDTHPQTSRKIDLESILKDSIERQMQADVPLGLFLSSGVDSSLLAALVNKYFSTDREVNFFTVSFDEETATNESIDASEFIKEFRNPNLNSHILQVDPEFIGRRLDTLYDFYDEPFGDYAAILNLAISEKAREHVTVALSGDGADELFWGYERYNKWQSLGRLNKFPTLSKAVAGMASGIPAVATRERIRNAFEGDEVRRHYNLFLLPAFRPLLDGHVFDLPLWANQNTDRVAGRKDAAAILDLKTYLADAMLYKVDRSSMAVSLEVRVPYLDNKVIDYSLGLPFEYKSNAQYKNKAILKNLLTSLAPHYNAERPKKGFSFPLRKWLLGYWKEKVLDTVTAQSLVAAGLEPKPYLQIINSFYQKKSESQVEVWYLFNLLLWKNHLEDLPIRAKR